MSYLTKSEVSAKLARERLRRRYRPAKVKILFVGEAPPASGRFFYCADSGLYRAMRDTFITAFPKLEKEDFLETFRDLGCYLVDLCETPVDDLSPSERLKACEAGEPRLAAALRKLKPENVISVLRSIGKNVERARATAGCTAPRMEVPYPGAWHQARVDFRRLMVPELRARLDLAALPKSPPRRK